MPETWLDAYAALKKFISSNPGIEIEPGVVSLPADVRPEFYRRFDDVRLRFIKDNFHDELEQSKKLVERWQETRRSVVVSLKLKSVETDADINCFLLDPEDGLIRFLCDPLFDLLKGKSDVAGFVNVAREALAGAFNRFLCEGYKYWTITNLIDMLSADRVYAVPDTELDKDPYAHMETLAQIEGIEEKAPDPVEGNSISFQRKLKYSFLGPSLIVHSGRLNSFAAFVPDFDYNESRWQAQRLSPAREWYKMSQIGADFGKGDLWPDIAMYLSDDVKELSVAGDHVFMGQPDIIIETKVNRDWYEIEGLESVKRHYNVLKPKIGSFVVCLAPVPAAAADEIVPDIELNQVPASRPDAAKEDLSLFQTGGVKAENSVAARINIQLLDVGYDANHLLPIVSAMIAVSPPVLES